MTATLMGMPTGFSVLDQALPQRGWPIASLTEILIPAPGIGELRVLVPMLRSLAQTGRKVVFLVPPSFSFVPALIQHGVDLKNIQVIRNAQPLDGLDSIEAALKHGEFGAIVAWQPDGGPSAKAQRDALRRLQLAARLSHCPAILFRSVVSDPLSLDALASSPAQLHLHVDQPITDTVRIKRLNPQRGEPFPAVTLSLPRAPSRQRPAPVAMAQSTGLDVGPRVASHSAGASPVSSSIAGSSSVTSVRTGIQRSLVTLAAALVAPRHVAPARTPWPFKQRRRTPDTPTLPHPVRMTRFLPN